MKALLELLDTLEEHLDPSHLDAVTGNLKKALTRSPGARTPVSRRHNTPSFTPFPMEETHEEIWKMMYNELIGCVGIAQKKDDALPMIRANYGVGTLPSLFGLTSQIVGNNLPWVEPLQDLDCVKALIRKGLPSLDSGFGGKVNETYAFYQEILSRYPKCRKYIRMYHPDYQGPFDTAHLICGSDIYYLLYDEPELIHELMLLVTEAYTAKMKETKKLLNDSDGSFIHHWHTLYPGEIVLRNDSAVNLSRDMYLEFVKPYDEMILRHFMGGSMHFCGRADQIVFDMMETENLRGLNFGYMDNVSFGEPFLNLIYEDLVKHKLSLGSYYMTETEFNALEPDKFSGISFVLLCSFS